MDSKANWGDSAGFENEFLRLLRIFSLKENRTKTMENCPRDLMDELAKSLFAYVYPILLFICLFGNTLNLIVYSQPFLRNSTTVRLLAGKAIAHTVEIEKYAPNSTLSLSLSLSPMKASIDSDRVE